MSDGEDSNPCNSGIRENPLRLLSGDFSHRPASCAEALLLWLPRLTRIAKGAGSWQDAQDLLQIMCEQLVRSWPAISVADKPLAYALQVAWYSKQGFIAKRATQRSREELVGHEDKERWDSILYGQQGRLGTAHGSLDELLELVNLLRSSLASLPEEDHRIYEFRRILEYRRDQVADIFDIPVHRVDRVTHKVDTLLQSAYEQRRWGEGARRKRGHQ